MIARTAIASGWSPQRLEALRGELRRRGQYGLLVLRWDTAASEQCERSDERLAWISGFTGAGGLALITLEHAVLFVESRHSLQAQASSAHFDCRRLDEHPIEAWLLQHAAVGQTYGYDAALASRALRASLHEAAAQVGARLVDAAPNPIDSVWTDRDAATPDGGGSQLLQSPVARFGVARNADELAGLRAASRRDGLAWCRFLMWLEQAVPLRESIERPVTEYEAEQVIGACRMEMQKFVRSSSGTISAAGGNAALCHYAAPEQGSAPLRGETLYLLDSAAEYLDGATGTARTLCFAALPARMRRHFTRALQEHARFAMARWTPHGRGRRFEAPAREPHLDRGQGRSAVGRILGWRERLQRVRRGGVPAEVEIGMTLTNRAGYSRAGRYGIRIESLCEVIAGRDGLSLRELTLVPIQRRLIDVDLLEPAELAWLNAYHARISRELSPLLTSSAQRRWLAEATAPLTRA